RFGSQLGQSILFGEAHLSSQALAQQHKASQVAEGSAVQQQAGAVAAMLAKLPIEVACWHKAELVKALTDVKAWPQTPEVRSDVHHQGVTEVALGSDVIRAIAHPDGVLEVHMEDREHKNMHSEATIQGLMTLFDHIAHHDEYKVVVLTGYDSYFSTGGTKEDLVAIQEGKAKFTDEKIYHLAMACSVPVIAAMQGHAIGAGWALGMFADITMFSEESKYLSPYMNLGFTPGAGATAIFPDKLGYDLAVETLLTAQEKSGKELQAQGMGFPVMPRRQLLNASLTLAKRIAQLPRAQLVAVKAMATAQLEQGLEEIYALELAMHDKTFVGRSDTLQQIQQNFLSMENANSTPAPAPSNEPEQVIAAVPSTQNTKAEVLHDLKQSLANELHMEVEEIDEDMQFIDLGLDSIYGVTWIRKINEEYGLSIEAIKVYSYPTLAEFSDFVVAQLKPKAEHSAAVVEHRQASATSVAPEVSQGIKQHSDTALEDIRSNLKQLLAQELFMEESEIDEDAQFIDLGLDSIYGVTWIRKINEAYDLQIEAIKIYTYSTLTALSQFVFEQVGQVGNAEVSDNVMPLPTPQPISPEPVLGVSNQEAVLSEPSRKLVSWRKRPALQAQPISSSKETRRNEIAVIGMAGKFPQANNLDEYWQNISQGKHCITEVASRRWEVAQFYQAGEPVVGKTNSKWFGAMDGYDHFDPLFFSISPSEAVSIDPQQRLFLQTCWHTIEDAGYDASTLSGQRCGVFVGCAAGEYDLLSRDQQISAEGFTGGATSILAARISYFMNLQGPCISIDTACSSSLVAIASACDSLTLKNCDLALAGGVYVMAGSDMHVMTAQAGMLSTDGKCFTFDQRANGFVPGEAVGCVLLKRLEDAQRDQDNIYGVVKGWGVNQDGKTNGITAPNPVSQCRLQQEVYDRFNINPNDIGLIEAHGTGTKLGDPIEVEGLKSAFGKYTEAQNYCALGSVKSNIGHCITAAGVAGFIKLALALQHKQLPPSINFAQLNEHINLENTPFYINQRLTPWTTKAQQLRHGAVSSFGFSGTNAHIVLSEYVEPEVEQRSVAAPWVFPISARTHEQLIAKVEALADFLSVQVDTLDMNALAYTLQIGRTHMEERVGLTAASAAELLTNLDKTVHGLKQNLPSIGARIYRGNIYQDKDKLGVIGEDAELKQTVVQKLIQDNHFDKLLKMWAQGLELDWLQCYRAGTPKRMRLPGYPFAKDAYWIALTKPKTVTSYPRNVIHPLLHINTSDMYQQSYQSTFTGSEAFLAHHQIDMNGGEAARVLPGVAYLEMAREAVVNALPREDKPECFDIKHVAWVSPCVVDSDTTLTVSLQYIGEEDGGDCVEFEIFSEQGGQKQVHCMGQLVNAVDAAAAVIDLPGIREQMSQGELGAEQIYHTFDAIGLSYGESHQGLRRLYKGSEQALGVVEMPDCAVADASQFTLHPSMLDAALQASMGLSDDIDSSPSVPFGLDNLRVFAACPETIYAWVRYPQTSQTNGDLSKVDIDICDEHGNVCMQLQGFSMKEIGQNAEPNHSVDQQPAGGEIQPCTFNESYYKDIIEQVANNELSVEAAVRLG
ncbi:polyketide synthase of type I, partial [Pseudoalteromonas sp. J010]|uniref:beta-ketoacyl synthase N-terminal-like domain-containing protein n=1 Tax=Pseudoalteromonas sp. J010 TaxID=998465 RepID=UPI000FAB53C2